MLRAGPPGLDLCIREARSIYAALTTSVENSSFDARLLLHSQCALDISDWLTGNDRSWDSKKSLQNGWHGAEVAGLGRSVVLGRGQARDGSARSPIQHSSPRLDLR